MAYILDDDKKICKGTKTGLWVGKDKYYSSKPDGSIFIPYGYHDTDTKVIMIHEDFAQLGEFRHKTETYTLHCHFFLKEESVVVGQNA